MKRTGVVAVLAVLSIFLSACGINSIPRAEEEAKAKWAEVENQYQRRLDLLPNLANAVRANGQQELALQIGVAEARARTAQTQIGPDQLRDANAMRNFAAAQSGLSSLLSGVRVNVTTEATPNQRNTDLVRDVLTQIEGTENRIAVARRDYNLAVQAYNTRIRTFPAIIGARIIYGSQPIQPYEASEGAERAPNMDFGNYSR
ncbi:MAG TPA: LemA family protein [Allosphingosinicella sp.]|nr:LemA family protein [Allosphingosinicella sp.]